MVTTNVLVGLVKRPLLTSITVMLLGGLWLVVSHPVSAFDLPPAVQQINSDVLVNKTGIVAVPYIMNDWENCDPATLKRGIDTRVDCWSHLTNEQALPSTRAPYAVGSFGSHIAFSWNNLHLGPGQYDWSSLDTYLQTAASMQIQDANGLVIPFKPVVITFSEYLQRDSNPTDGQKDFISYIPDFVKAEIPANQLSFSLPNCDVQDMVPYHHPAFQQYYREFVQAALRHIAQSPNRHVVQAYLMSGGVSHETTPAKNLPGCPYGTYYRERYLDGYIQFIKESLQWTDSALRDAPGRQLLPAMLQPAAAWPTERYTYFRTAHPLNIGFKMNSLAPSNANGINARPIAIGLYDALAMTELTWPKGFEPVFPIRSPSSERCSARYCDTDARYQGVYWSLLTALGYKADQLNLQKEYYIWRYQLEDQFNLPWLQQLLEQSIGKAANQSRVAWIAFAERFNDLDSFPNPRPEPPLEVGEGDYYRAEFTERGDRDFYLYRLGEIEDSTLIRQQAGVIPTNQNNYALLQNSCFRFDDELPGQAQKIVTGQELRNSGWLHVDHFAHPFSATALMTEGGAGRTHVSLALEPAVTSVAVANVKISVEYLDVGTDQFALEHLNDQNIRQRQIVTKTNTKRWKTAEWNLRADQISWNQNLLGGADLALNCLCDSASGDDIFHMVRVEAVQDVVKLAPSNELQYCQTDRCMTSPDFNRDSVVNLADISMLITNLTAPSFQPQFDLNCDGQVNLTDLQLLFQKIRW